MFGTLSINFAFYKERLSQYISEGNTYLTTTLNNKLPTDHLVMSGLRFSIDTY